MKVTFTLSLDSASFFDAPEQEVRQAFGRAADLVCNVPCGPNGISRTVHDTNGNTCGKVVVR